MVKSSKGASDARLRAVSGQGERPSRALCHHRQRAAQADRRRPAPRQRVVIIEQRYDLPDPRSLVERQGGKVHPR
ncbi:MAG: hypothetical protein MZV70_06205 [Desulfobacterales bacterium]|nr:hypothetical protein [Desulfobacterales bacterium]